MNTAASLISIIYMVIILKGYYEHARKDIKSPLVRALVITFLMAIGFVTIKLLFPMIDLAMKGFEGDGSIFSLKVFSIVEAFKTGDYVTAVGNIVPLLFLLTVFVMLAADMEFPAFFQKSYIKMVSWPFGPAGSPESVTKISETYTAKPTDDIWACPKCGIEVLEDDHFCPNCGNDFSKNPQIRL